MRKKTNQNVKMQETMNEKKLKQSKIPIIYFIYKTLL